MDNNKLTTVRQLTPIRFWRWGKVGSLFFIGKSETSHPLYVIRLVKLRDKMWSSPKRFDPLFMWGYLQQTSQNIVLRGFAAYLFDLTNLNDIKPDTIYLLWRQYCNLVQEEGSTVPFYSQYQAAKECLFWSQRDNQILQKFFSSSAFSEIERALMLVCNYECNLSRESMHNMVFNTHPVIAVRKENTNTFIRYDELRLVEYKYLEKMDATIIPDEEGKTIARGFQAAFINYCMAKNAYSLINTFTPEKQMIGSFHPQFANVLFESVPFHCLDVDINELFETYLNYVEKAEMNICNRDADFLDLKDQQKRNFVLHRIFQWEMFTFTEQTITQYYLSEIQLHFVEEQTRKFIKYLLGQMQNSQFMDDDLKEFLRIFPSHPIVPITEVEALLTIPAPNKYDAVVQYVIERRKFDPAFAAKLDKCKDRKERCALLSDIFGWILDANALGKNVNSKSRKNKDTGGL